MMVRRRAVALTRSSAPISCTLLLALSFPGSASAQSAPDGQRGGGTGYLPAALIPPCNDYRLKHDGLTNNLELSKAQRACIYLNHVLAPSAFVGASISALYGQVTHDQRSWGQGLVGYSRRYAARYAQGATKATGEYLTAWLLHEEPRSRRSGCRNSARALCAARSLFYDSVAHRPVFSKVVGALAGGFVGMSYYPQSNTIGQALKRSGTSLASSLVYAEFFEFQPAIFRAIGNWFSPKGSAAAAGASSTDKQAR